MERLFFIHEFIETHQISLLLILGLVIVLSFFFGKSMKFIKLPSIIGFMLIGVALGPSLFNILDDNLQQNLSFITDIALGFVAVSIGLELSFSDLKRQGRGIIGVILLESFMAFFFVTLAIYLLTHDLALSLIFGSIAPASAPAGTVAVIKEYKARGSLTQALYAVVGFDDGLGIIIFGFAAAFAKSILAVENGGTRFGLLQLIGTPFIEIGLSLLVGAAIAVLFSLLSRKLKSKQEIYILLFASVLITAGLCQLLHLSLILTNMIFGIVLINTQPRYLVEKIHSSMEDVMPLLFILFFILAGSNLHVMVLPSLGLLGLIYILTRSGGLIFGAVLGALLGKMEDKIRKYLGLGILSQAGVAIGLSIIVRNEFTNLSAHGARIGSTVLTAITATCIVFEIIGPILTRIGLQRAGEIKE